jgi:Flp pilus assembly protein TadG
VVAAYLVVTDSALRGFRRRNGATARAYGSERGTVTAEAALVLPVVAMFVLALMWLLAVGIAKIQTVDAARDAARVLARGDGTQAAVAAALLSAPTGAHVAVGAASPDRATVTVTVNVTTPGWLLVHLPGVTLSCTATTPTEASDARQ